MFVCCIQDCSNLLRNVAVVWYCLLWVQALARLAEEIAQSGIPVGSRKINGKYIHSHLVARLEGIMVLPWLPHMISSIPVWFTSVLVDNYCWFWCGVSLVQINRSVLSYQRCLFCVLIGANAIVFAYIAVHEQMKEQIKDVDAAQSKEVSVFWVGMAEVNTLNSRLPNIQWEFDLKLWIMEHG